VYAILTVQLVITAGTIYLFGTTPALSAWMHHGMGALVPLVSLLLSTAAWVLMSISPHARRSSPMKWQMLVLFTLGEALSVGFVSSFYEMRSVITTMVVTALTTSSLSLYIMRQRHLDTTQWGATLSSMGLVLVFYGLIQVLQYAGIIPAGLIPYNEKVYGIIGATLFSAYLAYHTKVITAGNNSKYQMNEKDYVFGASTSFVYQRTLHSSHLCERSNGSVSHTVFTSCSRTVTLYNDIINFFVYLLKALGEEREE
jgi:protein lifeguard